MVLTVHKSEFCRMTGYVGAICNWSEQGSKRRARTCFSYWHIPSYPPVPQELWIQVSIFLPTFNMALQPYLKRQWNCTSLQTFTGKLNSKLPHKNEDKRGQRHIICSNANYLRSMCKRKGLKYVVLSSMIQEVKVSEEQKYINTIIPSLLYQL